MGTGSNTGLWDGHSIVANTPPLGFILGDEGSGAALGARLVSDIYKGLMAEEIVAEFDRVYGLSKADIIENVYRRPAANRFLASFCPFLSAHLDHPDIAALVIGEFTRFISRNLMQYNPLNKEEMCIRDRSCTPSWVSTTPLWRFIRRGSICHG